MCTWGYMLPTLVQNFQKVGETAKGYMCTLGLHVNLSRIRKIPSIPEHHYKKESEFQLIQNLVFAYRLLKCGLAFPLQSRF